MIYISHLIDDKEMKEIIASTGAGIESIEFSVAENLDHFSRTLKNYRKRLEFMNCQNLILHGPFLDLNPMAYDSLVVQATKTRYEQAYQAAKELGAKKLILHSGFIPSVYFLTGWAERMADFYNRFLDDKDDSVEILMENVMDPFPSPLKMWQRGFLILPSASALILDIPTAAPKFPAGNGQRCFCPISAIFTFTTTPATKIDILHWGQEAYH